MLKPEDVLGYEMAVVFGGCLLMLILQIFTGPIFTWIIWAMAVAVVSLEYVDHCCIGWKLTPQTQLRRVVWNSLLCAGTSTSLYWSVYFLIPNVDMHDLASVLAAMQYSMRLYNYWGPIIYAGLYTQFYTAALSFFRALINLCLVFYAILQGTDWTAPAPSRGQGHGGHVQSSGPRAPGQGQTDVLT